MNETADAYRGIARHYDRHFMDWYASTYGDRFRTLLDARGLAHSRLLDAGCGTGTMALALSKAGHEVTGVDLSRSLLDLAREKDRAAAVRWILGDLRTFEIDRTFDVVLSVADVLNHLETLDEWEAVFRRLHAALRPGGFLFFDCLTSVGLERQDTYTVRDQQDGTLVLGVIWEPATRRSTLKITSYVPGRDSELWERATETIVEWGQPVREIFERLRSAGFDEPERPFARESDPEKEERLAVFARRR